MKLHTPLLNAEGTERGTGGGNREGDEHENFRPRDERRDDRPRGGRREDRGGRDERRDDRRDDRPRGERQPPTAEEVAREMRRLQAKDEPKCPPPGDKSKEEKPKGAGWYASGPTWFFNALGCAILVIIAIIAVKMLFPDFGVRSSFSGVGFNPAPSAPAPSGFTPIPEAERHPALRDAFDASRVRNTKDGIALNGFPPDVVEKIRAGARAVHVLSTNKVWSLYPPPYSASSTVQIP